MRTILISGANRGIGKSIALRVLKDGHRVSLGVRKLHALKGTQLDPDLVGPDRILLSKYEADDPQTAKEWVNQTINHFGSFDSVINCAGIFHGTKFLFSSEEQADIDELWKINVIAPWLLTKEAWEQISRNGEGRVIFLISMSGKRSKGNLAGYSMSKFALMGLCQTIRNEGWNKGVRVTAICPSWVNTDMAKNIKSINKDEMTQPKDIASISSNLLALPNTCVPFEIAINCNLET